MDEKGKLDREGGLTFFNTLYLQHLQHPLVTLLRQLSRRLQDYLDSKNPAEQINLEDP